MKVLNPAISSILIIITLTVFCLDIHAQDERSHYEEIIEQRNGDEEEVDALNEQYWLIKKLDPELGRKYLERALMLSRKIDYKKGEASTLRLLGSYYNLKGMPEEALQALQRSRSIYESIGDPAGVVDCLNGMGNLFAAKGDFKQALAYFLATAELNKTEKDTTGLAAAYQNIGGVHYSLQRFDKAFEYLNKSLELKESIKDTAGMIVTMSSISTIYTAWGEYQRALDLQKETLKMARKGDNLQIIASITGNMGVQYHYMNQLDTAKKYYSEAIEICRGLGQRHDLAMQYINIGQVANLLGDRNESIAYFDSSLALCNELGARHLMATCYQSYSETYLDLKDYKQAYDWMEKYYGLKDSLSGENVQHQLNELQEKYESGQKDIAIAELQRKEARAVSVVQKRTTTLIVTIISTLAALLVLLFYLGRRKARERQRQAELEQKALRTQMNPHFIFNSLGAIQQMYMSGEMDLANNYLGDFSTLMRKILDNSGKDKISVKEELQMLELYIELEKGRSNGLVDFHLEVDERIDQVGISIPPMVIQPFVENAIWHGVLPKKQKGNIGVRLWLDEEKSRLECQVTDDGVGIGDRTERKKHEPKGMKITEQRLGTEVLIKDLNPGTQVIIYIPI